MTVPRLTTATVLTGALIAALVGCAEEPIAFAVRPIPVAFDRVDVLDADAVDLEHDGDMGIVVVTVDGFRFLESSDGRFVDGTAGTALGKLAAAQAMHRVSFGSGNDYVLQRGGHLVRLEYSGIGSWHEVDDPVDEDFEPGPTLEVSADLDGDGVDDRARLVGDRISIELARNGSWLDVTALVGADGLRLPQPGRRLRSADLDGDGHVDLLLVGGRLIALMNNGGVLMRP